MKTLINSLAIAAAMLWNVSAHAGASRVGNDYYEDIFPSPSCSGTGSCSTQSSAPTPAGVFFRMQHLYCRISTTSTSAVMVVLDLQIWTGPQGTGTLVKSVPLSFSQPVSNSNLSNYYSIDHDILLTTGSGRYIVIAAGFTANTAITMNCAITGNLIPPPQ